MSTTEVKFFAAAALLAFASNALAEVRYVDVNSTNATPPYTNWTTAATKIRDAVDAAVAGDEIVVTNGIYATGGRANGYTTNRVAVNKPLSVRSVNGPQSTTIDGGGSVRCVYLTNSARLAGFTLTNGAAEDGGGAYGGTLDNCTLSGNLAGDGGGAYGGTLNNCTLTNNYSLGELWGGGGAAQCTLNNCTLIANSTGNDINYGTGGGGAAGCTLNNCTLTGNIALQCFTCTGKYTPGGGAYECILNNCTLTGNQALNGAGDGYRTLGGGAYGCVLNNTIDYLNFPSDDHDYYYGSNTWHHSWTSDPLFVDTNGWADLRLQSNSPCINAGNNSYVTNATDLDGNPRIAGGTVDIGAYEFQSPASMISYAWLQHFNLPINPATDTADPDGDGVDNYHEWLAGTDPTNRFSSPAQLTITPSGVPPSGIILTWPTNAVGFTLQSTTNLVSPVWSTNSPAPVVIGGQNVLTNPLSGPQQFYRLKQ